MTDDELPGREFWYIDHLFENPLQPPNPYELVECPVCRNDDKIWFKDYSIFKHPLHPGEYRMDIALKCDYCGFVIRFAPHITTAEFNSLNAALQRAGITTRRVTWKDIGEHISVNDLPIPEELI